MSEFIIDPSSLRENPFDQFTTWFAEYQKTKPLEPNAMFLATADGDGVPSGRVVLLKAFDKKGFVFYTNYESRKGHDLAVNPLASLTFYWEGMSRQVRIFGKVKKVSREESDIYFASRELESRLGAWASSQGKIIKSRSELLEKLDKLRAKFKKNIPRPEYWGGYRVMPSRIEFWQGRDNRMHDRVEYLLKGKAWKRQRLSP